MLSYFVVADLLLALHLDAAAVPSTLTVSVEQCTNIWDRLLQLYHRRGKRMLAIMTPPYGRGTTQSNAAIRPSVRPSVCLSRFLILCYSPGARRRF